MAITEPQVSHTRVPIVETHTASSPAKAERISALDFTKGALVLIMVLYHWINYFIGGDWPYYRYLRFLTPSFIFVTGFMISNVYLSKYKATDPRLPKRLFTRGLKLLAIFVALNTARTYIAPALGTAAASENLPDTSTIFSIFVSGNSQIVGDKLVSFSILVPISYLLMLAAALMIPHRFFKYTFHAACAFFFLSALALGLSGAASANLELVSIGMMGVLAGFAPMAAVNHFVRHPFLLGLAYVCYTAAITIWGVPFLMQVVGVPLSLMVIYLVGISGNGFAAVRSEVILLGKYSLFGYISQIAILQTLAASLRHFHFGFALLAGSFLAAFTLTIISVEILDRLRTRTATVNRLYKAVFA